MKTLITAFLTFMLVTHSQLALAQSNTTTIGELVSLCEMVDSQQVNYGSGYCMGLIFGTIQTSLSNQEFMASNYGFQRTLCLPDNWKLSQGIKVFLKWARENPERLHEPDFVGVYASQLQSFRCK